MNFFTVAEWERNDLVTNRPAALAVVVAVVVVARLKKLCRKKKLPAGLS